MSVLVAIGEGLAEIKLTEGAETCRISSGGDAANICVMASRLGAPARLVGRVGDDELGRFLARYWDEQGVDVSMIKIDPEAQTGLYINEADPPHGHRLVYWRRGSAGSRLSPSEVEPSALQGVEIFVFTGVTLAISASAAAAVSAGVSLARDAGASVACVLNHRPALGSDAAVLRAAAAESDIVIGARDEFDLLYPEGSHALDAETVVTDGARGAVARWGQEWVTQPAPAVVVTNAAGAGDALAGAYLARRAAGSHPDEALRDAVAAASLSVQADGCAHSYPTAQEVDRAISTLPPQTSSETAKA